MEKETKMANANRNCMAARCHRWHSQCPPRRAPSASASPTAARPSSSSPPQSRANRFKIVRIEIETLNLKEKGSPNWSLRRPVASQLLDKYPKNLMSIVKYKWARWVLEGLGNQSLHTEAQLECCNSKRPRRLPAPATSTRAWPWAQERRRLQRKNPADALCKPNLWRSQRPTESSWIKKTNVLTKCLFPSRWTLAPPSARHWPPSSRQITWRHWRGISATATAHYVLLQMTLKK